MNIIEGREDDPARVIRERFEARWVTLWKLPAYRTFATRLVKSGQAQVVFSDPYYFVLDLGKTAAVR